MWTCRGRAQCRSPTLPDRPDYAVLVSTVAQRDYERLTGETRALVLESMKALADDPRGQAEKLVGEDSYRVRVGDYRIVFRVDGHAHEELVTRIKHRREVYRRLR